MTASGDGVPEGREGLSKKKGLKDNIVVIAAGRGIRGLNGDGKNTIKIK